MRPAPPAKQGAARTEQIILFRVGGQLFAVSSASVQEVRSADSLGGLKTELSQPELRKVRHVARRGGETVYVINGAMHFGLPATPSTLVFVLRHTRTALLIDGIEKMTTMTRLQALPKAFCHEERQWYRGLTTLEQSVVPVVEPAGFLTPEEMALLDAALPPDKAPEAGANEEAEWAQ
jgi:chemotaxis signal transduction protein